MILMLRISETLKTPFQDYCESKGVTMSEVIRGFILSKISESKTTNDEVNSETNNWYLPLYTCFVITCNFSYNGVVIDNCV